MPNRLKFLVLASLMAASAAIAHTNVKDPTVRAWMHNMMQIAEATKILGSMAKGETAFDADVASDTAQRIAEGLDRIPALFEVPATDPTSEALPTIWTDWDRFVELSREARQIAAAIQIATEDDLRVALKSIGGSCSACHEDYRE